VTAKRTDWTIHPNPLIRLGGRERPARWVLAQALQRSEFPVRALHDPHPHVSADFAGEDEVQIDPALPIEAGDAATPEPVVGSGYAGFTAAQRSIFYNWLLDPTQPAAQGYQHLYLAHLETRLFETEFARAAQAEILHLLAADAWRKSEALVRVGLLAGWLAQDAAYLRRILAADPLGQPQRSAITASLLNVGLAWYALLEGALKAPMVAVIQQKWLGAEQAPPDDDELALLQLNLSSLTMTLGSEPLRYVMEKLLEAQAVTDQPVRDKPVSKEDPEKEEGERTLLQRWQGAWLPWRTIHRDLRCALPQPDLRPTLEPLMAELLKDVQRQTNVLLEEDLPEGSSQSANGDASSRKWQLVLEFGDSRSQFYEYVLIQAQKQPDYMMIMDETRQIVHRISYQKRHMRQFWRLWDYVQNWSSTRVYLNGQEMEKWKVWPYSQHLR
jgi:hypothetical protein